MMKKLLKKLSDFCESHKNQKYFKAKVLIIVLIVMVFAVQIYDSHRTQKESASSDTSVSDEAEEGEITLEKILRENKSHIIIFIGLTSVLGVVKLRQQHRIKESK